MGVKRKRQDSVVCPYTDLEEVRDMREYSELKPITGFSQTDKRWCNFYVMMDWCFLKLGYEICNLPEDQLNVIDRRSAYFCLHNRTLMAALRPGWATNGCTEHQYELGTEYVRIWNKCIARNLIDMNNVFRQFCTYHDYLHRMRDGFLIPMRRYLREYFKLPAAIE